MMQPTPSLPIYSDDNLAWPRSFPSFPSSSLGMHIPRLCLGKRAHSTGNTTTSVPTWVKHINAEIPASAGMTRKRGDGLIATTTPTHTSLRGGTADAAISWSHGLTSCNNDSTPPVIPNSIGNPPNGIPTTCRKRAIEISISAGTRMHSHAEHGNEEKRCPQPTPSLRGGPADVAISWSHSHKQRSAKIA